MLSAYHLAYVGAPFDVPQGARDKVRLQLTPAYKRDIYRERRRSLLPYVTPTLSPSSSTGIWKSFVILLLIALVVLALQTYHFVLIQPTQIQPQSYEVEIYSRMVLVTTDPEEFDFDCRLDTDVDDEEETTYNFPLLTLFTSMKDSEHRRQIQNRTIYNWAELTPFVQPVLYADKASGNLTHTAKEAGWVLRPVPRHNHGIPVFKAMFQDATEAFNTPFYAFANADILFDDSLLVTLKAMFDLNVTDAKYGWTGLPDSLNESTTAEELAKRPASGGLLVIGRRTNVNVTDLDDDRSLREVANKEGKLFITNAEDYFITTKTGMPWHNIPDLVIGRPGYDNWLVSKAIEWKTTVVDASDAILAVHQTGSDGNLAGWSTNDDTLCLNRNMVGAFDYRPGHSKCCPFVAQKDISGATRIFRRNQISKDCLRIGHPPRGKDAKCI